ncbi:hypothetical protein Tco_0915139 [Tanacetum coccineum]
MWATDRIVAPTPGSAITITETANEFAIKGQSFPPSLFDRLPRCDRAPFLVSMKMNLMRYSNSNTDKIMARIDAMTMKMDAQYKEMQSRSNDSIPEYDEDDKPMSPEVEAKFMQTF